MPLAPDDGFRAALDVALSARSRQVAISAFAASPFRQQGTHDNGLDDKHDLVAVGVVRAQLRSLSGVEPAFEQRAQDRRVDLRPVEIRRREHRFNLRLARADSAESSSNSPPSNQATSSKPTRPPPAIAPNRVTGKIDEFASGRRRACSSIRVNMPLGSRPTSSANMQNTSRLTKCATDPRVVAALSQSLGKRGEGRRRALSVSACRVSPGRRRSGSESAHLSLLRTAASARSSSPNSWTRLTLLVQWV